MNTSICASSMPRFSSSTGPYMRMAWRAMSGHASLVAERGVR